MDSYRQRKRDEDTSRAELKSRTKTLEDSKRHAEGHKRDAEKRLKAAQNARDDCTQRMAYFDTEITNLQLRSENDTAAIVQIKVDSAKAEQEISEALESKKLEIKVAEDVIAALNARTKELEEKLARERERLDRVRERAEIRKQDHSFYPLHVVNPESNTWSPIAYATSKESPRNSSASRDVSKSPAARPARLSIGDISNYSAKSSDPSLRSQGYTIFDDDLAPVQPHHTTKFSPFGDADTVAYTHGNKLSPTTSLLIPAGLMSHSTESLARSFRSENDVFLDKDWRGLHLPHSQSVDGHAMVTTSSPTALTFPAFNEYDPFEVRHPEGMRSEYMNSQRAFMPLPNRNHSDPTATATNNSTSGEPIDTAQRRRWFSMKDKPKKGLNPDAKVFHLTKSTVASNFGPIGPPVAAPMTTNAQHHTFDALNPNGLGSHMMSAASSNVTSSLLRAFAPSPAEREVLQRAFGGSTNASLERLPSLSRVGSITSSPTHVHAVAVTNEQSRPASLHLERGGLPSWLQSLPRIGKTNFSPWDDEEPLSSNGSVAHK